MFPPLSVRWAEQIADQKNFRQLGTEDFERLRQKYGVSWVVLEQPTPDKNISAVTAGLECPYQNSAVRVCKLN